jgi:hypothetical protein
MVSVAEPVGVRGSRPIQARGQGGASRTGPRRRVHTLPAPAFYAPGFDADASDDAATLVYDTPSRQPADPFPSAPEPSLGGIAPALRGGAISSFARARVPRFSDIQLAVIMLCALIGALAAAWTIEQQGPGAVPPVGAVVTELAKLWKADAPAKVAAATPQVTQPPRPAVAASAAAAPEAQPSSSNAAQASVAKTSQRIAKVAQPAAAKADKPQRREQKAQARTRPSRRAQSRAESPQAASAHAAAPTAAPAAGTRTGLLRINSRPWSKVYVDGRPMGSTPQTAIELSPGRHRIALVSDEFDLKRTLTVDIRAGKIVTRSVELMQ